MSPHAILAAMRDLVADRLARKPGEVTAASRLVDDLGADSLDFVDPDVIERLLPALPALSDVADPARVTPADVFGLITVDTLCAMVARKQGARA